MFNSRKSKSWWNWFVPAQFNPSFTCFFRIQFKTSKTSIFVTKIKSASRTKIPICVWKCKCMSVCAWTINSNLFFSTSFQSLVICVRVNTFHVIEFNKIEVIRACILNIFTHVNRTQHYSSQKRWHQYLIYTAHSNKKSVRTQTHTQCVSHTIHINKYRYNRKRIWKSANQMVLWGEKKQSKETAPQQTWWIFFWCFEIVEFILLFSSI